MWVPLVGGMSRSCIHLIVVRSSCLKKHFMENSRSGQFWVECEGDHVPLPHSDGLTLDGGDGEPWGDFREPRGPDECALGLLDLTSN